MKPVEVFVKYCKLKGIMRHIKKIENNSYVTSFKYSADYTFKKTNITISDSISDSFENKGFFWMFCDFECICWRRILDTNNYLYSNDEYYKAARCWRRFVRNNVILKNDVKKGDKVKFVGRNSSYAFIEFAKGYRDVIVRNLENNRLCTFRVKEIEKINDEDFAADFYIKFKGKIYE